MTAEQKQAEIALFEVWWKLEIFAKKIRNDGAGKEYARLAWMARAASQYTGEL